MRGVARVLVGRGLGEPKIKNLGAAARQENVRRLDVAMDDPVAVRAVERIGHGDGDIDENGHRHRTAHKLLL